MDKGTLLAYLLERLQTPVKCPCETPGKIHDGMGNMVEHYRLLETLEAEARLVDRIHEITAAHPLQALEAEYLAETVMMYHGAHMFTMDKDKAGTVYMAIMDWLESTGRISPRESRELIRLAQNWEEAREE